MYFKAYETPFTRATDSKLSKFRKTLNKSDSCVSRESPASIREYGASYSL